jgi:Zn-finger nucleic acid-binding protein
MMTDRQGVEVDYCPQCRGVWLDRGELDKIIERSSPAASAQPARPAPEQRHYGHNTGHYDGGRYSSQQRKKKSFLSDIFDF